MKGRKSTELLHQKMWGESLFKERFFVFQDTPAAAPEAPDAPTAPPEAPKIGEEPKPDVQSFLDLAYKAHGKIGLPREVDSGIVAKDNPYMHALNSNLPAHAKEASGFVHSAGKLEIYFYTEAEYNKAYQESDAAKPGVMRQIPIIGHPISLIDPLTPAEAEADGEWDAKRTEIQKKPPYTIDSDEYLALVWPAVRDVMAQPLSDPSNGVPPSGITEMAQGAQSGAKGLLAFNKLALRVAESVSGGIKAPGVDDPLVKEVAAEYKAFKIATAHEFFGQQREFRTAGQVKREGLKHEVLIGYYKDYQKPDATNKLAIPADAVLTVPQINDVIATVRREKYLINADIWNPVDKKGLAEVRYYWKKLGIRINEQPHAGILNELAKPFDQSPGGFMKTLPPNINGDWFKEPGLHLAELASFPAGKEYVKAWNYFNAVKEFCKAKDLQQRNSTKAINEFSQTKPVEVIKDGLKKNFDAVGTAIRTGDWGTVAFYAIGIMAVLKVAKMTGGGDFVKRWGSYVVGGYFLVKVLDKAGYDASGKLGLKKKFEDLTGTAMENVLDYSDMPEFREIDPGVALHSLKMPARQLYLAKESSHVSANSELGWVDPAKFPAYRDTFIGESKPARPGSEYDRVGHELYKMIMALETLYIRKLSSNPNSEFHDISFENALNDDDLKDSKVEHWLSVMAAEGKNADEAMITGASQRFAKGLEGKMLDPQIRPIEIKGKKMIGGKIMGVPVVIIEDGKFYKVYSRIKYEKDRTSEPLKGGIPVEGDGKIEGLEEALKLEFMEQLKHKLEGGQRIPGIGPRGVRSAESADEAGGDAEIPDILDTKGGIDHLKANDVTRGLIENLRVDGDNIKMKIGTVERGFNPSTVTDFDTSFRNKFNNLGPKKAMAFLLETLKGMDATYDFAKHGSTPPFFDASQSDIAAKITELDRSPAASGGVDAVSTDTFDTTELAKKVKWDNNKWSYEDAPPGRSSTYTNDFGVDVPRTTITIDISDAGNITHDELNTPEKMLLNNIASDPNTAALAPFLNSDGMKVKKLIPRKKFPSAPGEPEKYAPANVVLTVGGVETVLIYSGGRFTEAPRAQSLLKDNTFRFEYAKLMAGRGMPMELSNEFNSLKIELEEFEPGIWQDVVHAWRKVTGDTDGQLLDGAVPKKRTLALLEAQKYALAQKLRKGAESMTSLADFSTFHKETLSQALEQIKKAKGNIHRFNEAVKRGHKVTNEDFQSNVVAEINGITGTSLAYQEEVNEIGDVNYDHSWGVASSDLFNDFHFKNADQEKTFAYWAIDSMPYTATIRLPDGSTELKKELAVPLDPPAPHAKTTTVDYVNPWEDPGERAYYIMEYNNYVKSEILGHNGDLSNPNNLDIENFNEWCKHNSLSADRVKDLQPYNHEHADSLHLANQRTQLEEAIRKAMDKAALQLIGDLADSGIKPEAVRNILYLPYTSRMDERNVGFLTVYDSPIAGQKTSRLWDFANGLKDLSRKTQEKLINGKIKKIILEEIAEHPGKYQMPSASWSTRAKLKYPILNHVPFL